MQRIITAGVIGLSLLIIPPLLSHGQDTDQSTARRKVLSKVTPAYPPLARKINLSGTVKLLVSVAPNGRVKEVAVFGGSPVLAQAAQSAVQAWKWESASAETKEPVEIDFRPE